MNYLPTVADGSVDVIITSPPYNIGVPYSRYSDRRPRAEYLSWCERWMRQVSRVLHREGTFWLQVGDFAKNRTLTSDLRAIASQYLTEQFEVIWAKSLPDQGGTQRGQFRPGQSPYQPDKHHEFVYLFSHSGRRPIDKYAKGVGRPRSDSNRDRWSPERERCCGGSIWHIPHAPRKGKAPHPAIFPPELPERCLRLHGVRPDLKVLDPFAGIGNTGRACLLLGIQDCTLVEIDRAYCVTARQLLRAGAADAAGSSSLGGAGRMPRTAPRAARVGRPARTIAHPVEATLAVSLLESENTENGDRPVDHLQSLEQCLTIVKDRVRACVHGKATGVYLHGRPGTSKTYTVRSTLDNLSVQHAYSNGHLTPKGLFELLAENHDRIIVLDDIQQTFNAPIALQILLAALGNGHDGTNVRYVRYKKSGDDMVVAFAGAIIGISNMPLAGHHAEVTRALRDRVHVIHYEPSDEQMIALMQSIAARGHHGIPPKTCVQVLSHLLSRLKAYELRPSMRLYVDKALRDYQLWEARQSESHWKDLVEASIRQELVQPKHPTNDISRSERLEVERRIALDLWSSHDAKEERIRAWKERTGGSQAGFYRRIAELRRLGQLPQEVG